MRDVGTRRLQAKIIQAAIYSPDKSISVLKEALKEAAEMPVFQHKCNS